MRDARRALSSAPAAAPTPRASFERELHDGVDAIRELRDDLRRLIRRWQLDERVGNAVIDVAHELLVNADRHGAPPVHLAVTTTTQEVRVEVTDTSHTPARLLPYRPGVSEHGLGLQLVRQLSRQWGQTAADAGKTVWAVFPAQRRSA